MNTIPGLRYNLFRCMVLLVLILCCSIDSNSQTLAAWSSTVLNANPSGAVNASTLATNASTAAVNRVGLGMGTGSSRYNCTGWNNSANYLQVAITPASGYTFNMSGKSFAFTCGSSNTGPASLKLYWSADNYTTAIGTLNSTSSSTATTTITLPTNAAYTALSSVTFRVRNESTASAGGSTVSAAGTCGPTSITVTGTVNAPPATVPTVTTTRATLVTASSIGTGGNVTSNGNATLTGKGVAWGPATNPVTGTSTSGTAIGAYTTSIPSLSPNTDYYYRAYATNSAGTGYGTNYDTTTLAAVPDIIADLNTLDPATSIDIVTDENGNPNGVPSTEHTTTYAVQETTTGKWLQANGTLGTTTTWMSAAAMPQTITGLDPLTQYCFRIKARNEDNKETALNMAVCVTTQAATGGISDVANNSIADFCNGAAHSFTLNYTSTLNAGTYTAQLSNASGSFTAPVSIGSSASAASMQVTLPSGTTAGTGYKIRIVNGSNTSDTTAAFAIKAAPSGTLTTTTALICPGQQTTAKLTFTAGANSVGPFELSIKNMPGNTTQQYSAIASGNPFDVASPQLPAEGSNDYQLLQITSANGCTAE